MPKVSVVVPVFNVRNYLEECLDSILQQTFSDIEVLCGDGGSTDGSLEILYEYAKKDSRVIVISKEGSGYGQSVNDCMDIAKGEYIGIVESDDAVKPDTYEVLYKLARKNDLDWIRGDIYYYYTDDSGRKKLERESIIYGGEFYNEVLDPQQDYRPYKSGVRTWSGIYKADFLNQYGIRHHETMGGSYQDVGFYLKTLYYARRVYFVDQAFYMWRQDNPGSSINYHSSKLVEKSLHEWRLNREYLDSHPELGKRAAASYHYRKFFSYLWTMDLAEGEDKEKVKKAAVQEFSEAWQKNEIDPGFFETWEWDRFCKTLQEWKENKGDVRNLPQKKKTARDTLRPIARLMQKLVRKLMAEALYHTDLQFHLLQDMFREQQKQLNTVMETVTGIAQEVEMNKQKTMDHGELLWGVKSRVEDIHSQTQASAQKILDQGDLLWRAKDRLEDIYNFARRQADVQAWNLIYELNREKVEQALAQSPLYDLSFYLNNRYGSVTSAQQILYVVFQQEEHSSVVDFGCGTGTWLWAAGRLGSTELLGIDGEYVPRELLMIPQEDFLAHNLELPVRLPKKYDLALSMEVAEHLPESAADVFVESICQSSDTVLFSAAHPGQGGDGHVNEQCKEYWICKFAVHGFAPVPVAGLFVDGQKVESWYRENMILFKKQRKGRK